MMLLRHDLHTLTGAYALDVGQGAQASPHPLALEACLHCVGDLVDVNGDCGGRGFLVALVFRGSRPDPVDGAPVGDHHRPGHRAALRRIEPARAAPDLEQDLLCHLLGLRRIPDHLADQAVHRPREAVIDDLKCGLVATRDVAKQ